MQIERIPENAKEIKAAFDKMDARGKARLRIKIGADHGLWSKIVHGKREASPRLAVLIDVATTGLIPASLLRPDIFRGLVISEEVVPKS